MKRRDRRPARSRALVMWCAWRDCAESVTIPAIFCVRHARDALVILRRHDVLRDPAEVVGSIKRIKESAPLPFVPGPSSPEGLEVARPGEIQCEAYGDCMTLAGRCSLRSDHLAAHEMWTWTLEGPHGHAVFRGTFLFAWPRAPKRRSRSKVD